jgi:hypothetical protein
MTFYIPSIQCGHCGGIHSSWGEAMRCAREDHERQKREVLNRLAAKDKERRRVIDALGAVRTGA